MEVSHIRERFLRAQRLSFNFLVLISSRSDYDGNPKLRASQYLMSVDIWYGGRTKDVTFTMYEQLSDQVFYWL
jgi:hypothetical protein